MISLDTLDRWAPVPLILLWILVYFVLGFELTVVSLLAILVCNEK